MVSRLRDSPYLTGVTNMKATIDLEKIVNALESLSKKEKLFALEDGEWLANFSVTQDEVEGLYADIIEAAK